MEKRKAMKRSTKKRMRKRGREIMCFTVRMIRMIRAGMSQASCWRIMVVTKRWIVSRLMVGKMVWKRVVRAGEIASQAARGIPVKPSRVHKFGLVELIYNKGIKFNLLVKFIG